MQAMKSFIEQNPHVSTEKIVSCIDTPVQKRIANLLLKGYTRDAAVLQVCIKSPELYSPALCAGGSGSVSTAASGDTTSSSTQQSNKRG